MNIKINCIYNDRGTWCKNKKIKRSLFGIGARCCIAKPWDNGCNYQQRVSKPKVPPPPPKRFCSERTN
jgi:hypothetical protein